MNGFISFHMITAPVTVITIKTRSINKRKSISVFPEKLPVRQTITSKPKKQSNPVRMLFQLLSYVRVIICNNPQLLQNFDSMASLVPQLIHVLSEISSRSSIVKDQIRKDCVLFLFFQLL